MNNYFAYIPVGLKVDFDAKHVELVIFELVGGDIPFKEKVQKNAEEEMPNIPIITFQIYPLPKHAEIDKQFKEFLMANNLPEKLFERLKKELGLALKKCSQRLLCQINLPLVPIRTN